MEIQSVDRCIKEININIHILNNAILHHVPRSSYGIVLCFFFVKVYRVLFWMFFAHVYYLDTHSISEVQYQEEEKEYRYIAEAVATFENTIPRMVSGWTSEGGGIEKWREPMEIGVRSWWVLFVLFRRVCFV